MYLILNWIDGLRRTQECFIHTAEIRTKVGGKPGSAWGETRDYPQVAGGASHVSDQAGNQVIGSRVSAQRYGAYQLSYRGPVTFIWDL